MNRKLVPATAVALFVLASCGGGKTIIREVQVTQPPTTVTEPAQQETMSTSEAIAWIREQAPTLAYESDASIYRFMGQVCDGIDQWSPDYRGYLNNAMDALNGENTEMRTQIYAIVVGAINSVCTQHLEGITAALDGGS